MGSGCEVALVIQPSGLSIGVCARNSAFHLSPVRVVLRRIPEIPSPAEKLSLRAPKVMIKVDALANCVRGCLNGAEVTFSVENGT